MFCPSPVSDVDSVLMPDWLSYDSACMALYASRLPVGGGVVPPPPPPQRCRRPPCPPPEQRHRGRHEQHPYDRRVDQYGEGEAEADLQDGREAARHEGAEDDRQEQGRAGDHPAGTAQTRHHGLPVVRVRLPGLAHPAEDEQLVVHGESERDRDDQRRGRQTQRATAGRGCQPSAREIPRAAIRTAGISTGTCASASGTTTDTAATTEPVRPRTGAATDSASSVT